MGLNLEGKLNPNIGPELIHPVGIKADNAVLAIARHVTNTGCVVVYNFMPNNVLVCSMLARFAKFVFQAAEDRG